MQICLQAFSFLNLLFICGAAKQKDFLKLELTHCNKHPIDEVY